MASKKKVHWQFGSVFAVPLPDGSFGLGQAIAAMWPNVIYCALTERRLASIPADAPFLNEHEVVARVALTREQLDYAAWPILGVGAAVTDRAAFSNEAFANRGYIGARIYDAALAEDFLAAFHALKPWDDWHDPTFLDSWLVSPSRKPRTLLYKADARAS